MLSFYAIFAVLSVIVAIIYAATGQLVRCSVAVVCLAIFMVGYLAVKSHREDCAKEVFRTSWCG